MSALTDLLALRRLYKRGYTYARKWVACSDWNIGTRCSYLCEGYYNNKVCYGFSISIVGTTGWHCSTRTSFTLPEHLQ